MLIVVVQVIQSAHLYCLDKVVAGCFVLMLFSVSHKGDEAPTLEALRRGVLRILTRQRKYFNALIKESHALA